MRCVAYLLQCDNAINVPLQNLHAIDTGMPSIPIHDESNVLWYRACSKYGEASTLEAVNGFVAQPVRGRREMHVAGSVYPTRVADGRVILDNDYVACSESKSPRSRCKRLYTDP
jgi:hypothetical protein